MYLCQARAEPVFIWDKIQVNLFCSIPNSDGHLLIYRIQEWINILVSLYFPDKRRDDAIFGSLNEDQPGGDWGKEICDREK